MRVEIHPWEVVAIVTLDDARRGVWTETEEKPKQASPLRKVVAVTDAKAVEALFDGLGKR